VSEKQQPPLFNGELMTRRQIAAEFGVCERTIMRWDEAGWVPHLKVGRSFYYRRPAVIEWFKANETLSGRRSPRRTRRSAK